MPQPYLLHVVGPYLMMSNQAIGILLLHQVQYVETLYVYFRLMTYHNYR